MGHRSKVTLLDLLSGPLQNELHREIFRPQLAYVPPLTKLETLGTHGRDAMTDLCVAGVSNLLLAREVFLFRSGGDASHMYIVGHGCLMYRYACRKVIPDTDADPDQLDIRKENLK